MSNSFNISVKPEIAALEAKVDIIDTEVGLVKTDTAAILIDTAEMQPKLPDENIMGSIVTVSLDGNIRSIEERTDNLPDDPASNTEVNANETKIDANKTVVDAIQAKTDLIPFAKGEYKISYTEATLSTDWETLINVTTGGRLYNANFYDNDGTVSIRITLDSIVQTFTDVATEVHHEVIRNITFNSALPFALAAAITDPRVLLNVEAKAILKVEVKRNSALGALTANLFYAEM